MKEIIKLHNELGNEDNWLATNNPELKNSPLLSEVVAIEKTITEMKVATIATIASKKRM